MLRLLRSSRSFRRFRRSRLSVFLWGQPVPGFRVGRWPRRVIWRERISAFLAPFALAFLLAVLTLVVLAFAGLL